MKRRLGLAAIIACAVTASCMPAAEEPLGVDLEAAGYMDVLFIGSSLTYWNNMPLVVAGLAAERKETPRLRVGEVASPNYSLEDHWAAGSARSEVARKGWEYVVLQQGPSSVPANRLNLITWTRRFADVFRPNGAKAALFAAWPQQDRMMDYPAAAESYRLAAAEVDGVLLPVSTAWRIAMEMDPTIELYSDGLHPSEAGTYLTSIVIYCGLYGRPASGLGDVLAGGRISVPAETGAVLRAAADSALALARPGN